MTSEYLRQRIWAVRQQCGRIEQEISEKQKELKKLQALSAQIKRSEASFSESCAGYVTTLQRMSGLDCATKAQSEFVQGVKGFLSGQDYQHAQGCFAVMKSRGGEMENKAEKELQHKKQELSNAKNNLAYLYKQLEIAIAQEAAQGTT